ncbi:MAG: murein biosynthesis integral membrane protein MurJ [Peptoniphilaceae bacterium]
MESTKKLAKSTFAIIFFLLIGKLFGFGREMLSAAKFGASGEMDAFVASQNATAVISMLITASIATTFIPALQKAEYDLGSEAKKKFTNNILFLSILVSLIIIPLGIFFAPQLSILFTPKTKPELYNLVVKLIQIGMPVIVFSAMVGVFTGFLQYEGRFGITGAVSIPLNLVYIIYLIFFPHKWGIEGLTVASVIAVLAQVIFLLPDSFKAGYRPKFILDFQDKYVKEALVLAVPVLISTAVNDVNMIVNKRLAMGMAEGSASILNYANKMNLMILGIFIAAITAIVFPTMSKAFGTNNMVQGKRVMNASIKAVLFLTVPATIGMIALARPIVDIAFLHGAFTEQNAVDTTATLRLYSLALISISISNVLNRVYYSISDTKTPFYVGLANMLINVGLNLLVAHKFGTRGLAASLSIATTIAVLISFYLLKKRIGNLGTKSYIKALIKTLMASTAMGLFALLYYPIESLFEVYMSSNASATFIKLVILLFIVAVAICIYGVSLYKLGVREIRDVVDIVKNKLNTRRENRI